MICRSKVIEVFLEVEKLLEEAFSALHRRGCNPTDGCKLWGVGCGGDDTHLEYPSLVLLLHLTGVSFDLAFGALQESADRSK